MWFLPISSLKVYAIQTLTVSITLVSLSQVVLELVPSSLGCGKLSKAQKTPL